jgi:hypothetical protein
MKRAKSSAAYQGSIWGRSVHIDGLWVDEKYRGQDYGSETNEGY